MYSVNHLMDVIYAKRSKIISRKKYFRVCQLQKHKKWALECHAVYRENKVFFMPPGYPGILDGGGPGGAGELV